MKPATVIMVINASMLVFLTAFIIFMALDDYRERKANVEQLEKGDIQETTLPNGQRVYTIKENQATCVVHKETGLNCFKTN